MFTPRMSMHGPFETRATEAYYYVTPPEPSWSAEQTEQHMSFYNRHALQVVSIHEAFRPSPTATRPSPSCGGS